MSPDRRPKAPGSPEQWIEIAESDLLLARLASRHSGVRPQQTCFHAQQAAEKALKAVLRFQRSDFPLTHDIEELLRLTEESGLSLPDVVREAGFLTPYAVEVRYPGYWAVITGTEVAEALSAAEQVVQWAKQVIQPPQGSQA